MGHKKIRALKPPKTKSSPEVIGILTDALREAREKKVLSVTVAMTTKDAAYSTFCIMKGGTFCETIGNIESLKDKVITRWKER